MAHNVEPMDIDSDFDNKENSLHHNNVLPFTEKGYEELDVSELNMKLRYSITPASSPMSKSYTANCLDNRSLETDDSLNVTVSENSNLTRSLNSTMTRNDNVVKSLKALPLQTLPTENFVDNRTLVLRPLDSTVTPDCANVLVTVSGQSDIDDLSLLSSSSSVVPTPEATTPTKDIQKNESGSPIMRGIKSVLNMFRSSQSPIPPVDTEGIVKPDILSPPEATLRTDEAKAQAMLVSTPISTHRKKEASPTKKNSPHKDSIVFNEDLEKELQWKDETTILFSQERIPIHKLFFQQPKIESKNSKKEEELLESDVQENLDSTVEYMDISYNDSIRAKTMSEVTAHSKLDATVTGESDSEFVDCETTFTKNESLILDEKDKTPVNDETQSLDLAKHIENSHENTSALRLKQIILNTTQDILDATLSITPDDLIPETLDKTKDVANNTSRLEAIEVNTARPIESLKISESIAIKGEPEAEIQNKSLQENHSGMNQEVDDTGPSEPVAIKEDPDLTKTINQTDDNSISEISTEVKNEDANVTTTIDNDIQPILDQRRVSTHSLTNVANKEDMNATKIIDCTSSEITLPKNPLVVAEDLDAASNNVAIISDNKMIKDQADIVVSKTGLDVTLITNFPTDATEHPVTVISSLTLLEGDLNKPLPYPDDEVEPNTVKEALVTELPVDIPLPDEDDLEKEINMHVDTAHEVSSVLDNPPLDLLDDIKVKSEIPEIIHNMPPEGANLKFEDADDSDKIGLPEVLLVNVPNFEGGDNIQHITEELNPKVIKSVLGVIENAAVKPAMEVSAEPNDENIDVLHQNESLNVDTTENNIEPEKGVETVNKTNNEQTVFLNQENVPMDVNESVVDLAALPDIINQTINVPNAENVGRTIDVSGSVLPEQLRTVPGIQENVASEEAYHEIRPEDHNNDVSKETISDTNDSEVVVVRPESTTAKRDVSPVSAPIEKNNEYFTTNISESCTTETLPVVPDNITEFDNIARLNTTDVIPAENTHVNEIQSFDTDHVPIDKGVDRKTIDEEIVLSENNSPFVSVIADDISKEECTQIGEKVEIKDDTHCTPAEDIAPPPSPPIASKGYNFNFDEIDDPFATKTKIRLSPPLDSPNKTVELKVSSTSAEKPILRKEINNRRKSQPERKRPLAPKRKLNSTFSGAESEKTVEKSGEEFLAGGVQLESPETVTLNPNNVTIEEDKIIQEAHLVHEDTLNLTKKIQNELEIKLDDRKHPFESPFKDSVENDNVLSKEVKTTSSSEQSTYYSAGTSSSESIPSRNVFNLPEIDDANFNPFASKSKIRQSPPPTQDTENAFDSKSKIKSSPETSMIFTRNDYENDIQDTTTGLFDDKVETELMEKDASGNLSSTTVSSKATDERNITMREVNTEDEDTIEGPFLEADDLNTDDKMSDFDGENIDMMQFNDLPTQGNEDNIDSGELFIDAEAFEFLLNQNKSNTVIDSGKESLFLKFDPLFAKRMSSVTSDGVVASLSKVQKKQSTPTKATKSPQKEIISPIAGPSNLNVTQDMDMNVGEEFNDDLNVTVSKPMMVVPPAVNPVTPRNKSLTPNRSNRRSITFTSPAMAVIDRLLSLSGNSSFVHDNSATQVSREQTEADLALTQLRELLAEKEIHVYSLRSESKELKDRLTTLESHLKNLEAESQDRLRKINELNDRLVEKTKINKSMAAVVEEYERTIASLISETAQDKKRHAEERIKLINERDEQTAHLASMEVSFSDLHSKYEKSKQVILNCKANEDAYKKSIKEFEENLTKMQTNYELLKQHATSKLNHANQELEKMNKTHEAEVLKLNAMIKRKELHITSLEESLAQKTKANEELTAICDELINKVG